MHVNLKSLIGRLDESARKALEAAAGLCLSRTHYDVEIEHFLLKLLDQPSGDFADLLSHFEIDRARLTDNLTRTLDRLKTGNARTPAISPSLSRMLSTAWTIASLDFESNVISPGHTLLALLLSDDLARILREISPDVAGISSEELRKIIPVPSRNSSRQNGAGSKASAPGSGKTPNLDQYTVNLTERARQGGIDPVLGRDAEVRQVVDILTRR
ncbi:MAG TPA: Clp protease N-terminal domain-containing protein, partial [Bryobacteraceae bacterium]|nr:Clp protease N-terminal domain-containing protein [Bryobacteraceae bacterium]